MTRPVKVIDLFAGPGGLGEGFSAYKRGKENAFRIGVSIEKEESAHRTLTLRALFRQYDEGAVPEAYYEFLKGNLGKQPEDQLYLLPEISQELEIAKLEAQKLTLGESTESLAFSKIDAAVGNDECVLIGGPPCQAYSLVGRSRNYGAKNKNYQASQDHRNFLYKEYLKVIARYQPMVFVMENVKGILSAKVDGKHIFDSILNDLKDPCRSVNTEPSIGRKRHEYKIYSFVPNRRTSSLFDVEETGDFKLSPKDFVIKAEDFGIPQARHRVILLGVRSDIIGTPKIPLLSPKDERPTVQSVIGDLAKLRSKLSKGGDSLGRWRDSISSIDRGTLREIKSTNSVDSELYDAYCESISNIDNSPEITGSNFGTKKIESYSVLDTSLKTWYRDDRMGDFIVNHETRGHIATDLHRYMYYSVYGGLYGITPKATTLPEALWPAHKNFSSGKFADRFRVQLSNKYGTTVTSHISKDGHYFIHPDPKQCRSFTVREAARIQTFPDNYFFVGTRTQQYVQVGNAVPPYLALQLAEIVDNVINN